MNNITFLVLTKVNGTVSNFLTTDAHAKAAVSQEATRQQVPDRTNPAQAKLEKKVGKYFKIFAIIYLPVIFTGL